MAKKAVQEQRTPKVLAHERKLLIEQEPQSAKSQKHIPLASFVDGRILAENCDESRELNNSSCYGTLLADGKLQLSALEAAYLAEKGKISIVDARKKAIRHDAFVKKVKSVEKNFSIRYAVFKDFRNRGYIIKTALKFGADFRVYDRGVKPGQDHARWIVFPVHESSHMTWYDFSAKNRVAHSTKKRLMIAAVDDEGDVTYWEVRWARP
ncbi:MAG: tRNA-intron lyase [archaeon]